MNQNRAFQQMLLTSLVILGIGSLLVAACYFLVDRPVAFFVHDEGLSRHVVLKWLTYPPPWLQMISPAVLALLLVRRAFGPFRRWELALLAASLGVILAEQFRDSLSFLLGRYWPNTWIDNNPSLIQDNAYGFHPFHHGPAYADCPSGHTARTAAVVAVFWIAYPYWWSRLLGVLATAAVVVGLVGMNYHFVGDTIAGGTVGAILGMYLAHFCGLKRGEGPQGEEEPVGGRHPS